VVVSGTETADFPRGAGRVESGPGARWVHLVLDLGIGGGWSTACPADFVGLDTAGPGRQVREVAELIDCPQCMAAGGRQVGAVNREVAERGQRDALARGIVTAFLRWAAEEHPEGGVALAVYAGSTRLHPMRPDERDRAIDLWLEATRERPDG